MNFKKKLNKSQAGSVDNPFLFRKNNNQTTSKVIVTYLMIFIIINKYNENSNYNILLQKVFYLK